MPNAKNSSGLTGRTRYRSSWRGKLILQVEYKQHYFNDLNGSGYYDEGFTTHWRDAKVEDLPGQSIAAGPENQNLALAGTVPA